MTVFSLGWSRMKRDQLAGDDWSGSLKGIIATSLTNKCLSLGWEHRERLMIIQATTFNLLLCHSICAQITLLIQGGLSFFFASLSWNVKATDDS